MELVRRQDGLRNEGASVQRRSSSVASRWRPPTCDLKSFQGSTWLETCYLAVQPWAGETLVLMPTIPAAFRNNVVSESGCPLLSRAFLDVTELTGDACSCVQASVEVLL